MVQNKPTPHKYRPERYKTIPHHTYTVLKKSVSSTMWDRGCGWYKKSFNSTKQFHLWSAIIGTQYNFRPVFAFFIPCATFSYHFGIIKNVWYATCLAQYRHSFFSHLYAHFSYPWHLFHTQMTCFHTWCKIFIPICYNQNHMVCNRLA